MSLSTFKSYLTRSDEAGMLRRIISVLLQGMSLQAAEGDPVEYTTFRSDFDRILARIGKDTPGQELLIAAGAANQAFAGYAQQTTRFIRQQGAVLHHIISMLTETMLAIGAGGERSAEHLRIIEKELARAVEIEDVQALRLRLDECLKDLRQEAARQKTQAQAQTVQLHEYLERARIGIKDPGGVAPEIDAVTGLPSPSAATAAFDHALETP